MPGTGGASHLECTRCGTSHPGERLQSLSSCCAAPLFARYDLSAIRARLSRDDLRERASDLWRYAELLPVRDRRHVVSLGEGWTPLLELPRLASRAGVRRLWIKEEARNPTGSFKARGLAVAVSRARELGARALAVPSAGNAASALAAYAAAAGLPAYAVVPRDTPGPIVAEIRALGAELEQVDGLIGDCAAQVAERARAPGWFDLSTLKEPYRVEGKKTMGYELAEQLGWSLPDAIVYPTGGGTGLIAMWKAFDELERLGWIGAERPKMIAVQASGCAPIVRAWNSGAEVAEPWSAPQTYAAGIRVPRAVGDFLILRGLRASSGAAVAVSDAEIERSRQTVGRLTGIYCAPEGAATFAALEPLRQSGAISSANSVVLFNTASGLKQDPRR